MRINQKAIINTVCAILLCIIALELYIIYEVKTGNMKLLDKLPIEVLIVESNSMYPKMQTGDCVIVYKNSYNDSDIGDIVSFYQNDTVITHKIVGRSDGKFITKGMSSGLVDYPVDKDSYIGKVIGIIPKIGYVASGNSPIGAIIVILCLTLIYFGYPICMAIINKKQKKWVVYYGYYII